MRRLLKFAVQSKQLQRKSKGIIVLGGDFNLLMNEKMDSESSRKHKVQKDAHLMTKFSKDMGLLDVWRTLNPTQRDYTYYSSSYRKILKA